MCRLFPLLAALRDAFEILFRILQGHDARERLKNGWISRKALRGKRVRRIMVYCYESRRWREKRDSQALVMRKRRLRAEVPKEIRIEANKAKAMRDKQRARALRKKKQLALSKKVQELYVSDVNYRLLHEKISSFFADKLKADLECLNSGKAKNISLAAKWCPTIDSSFDKHTLICASIGRKLFLRKSYPEYEGIEEAQYIYRVRDRLRKQVLVPLHKALKLPELFDQILKVAVAAKLTEEQMIKRLFVFSDMEFDQASLNPWETDYKVIQQKFRKNGYKNVPEIVFWNLRNSSATPVKATQKGVALLSGYSKNLMTLFPEGGGIISPENVMEAAVSGSEYQQLVVYD